MSPLAIAALGLLALAALVGWSWWRKWHRELAAARHTYRAAGEDVEAATAFYGSMNLDDERGLYWPAPTYHELAHELDWREATMVELSPEALDPGPGDGPSPMVAPGPADLPVWEDAKRWDVRVCANDSRPAAGADLTGSLSSRPPDEDPGPAAHAVPGLERLADTGDIRDAALLADTTTYMRDQDADVADWLAGRAITWARLEIGALT